MPDSRTPEFQPTEIQPTAVQGNGSPKPPDESSIPQTIANPESPSACPSLGDFPAAKVAVPGYEILGKLGEGGMGVVYHARHIKLNREVALKMILTGEHAAASELARFVAEAEAIAALNHPGIVQIHEIGQHEGKPYFALEYCSGGSLAKKLNGTPLPAREAAELAQKLAYAVHAAHEKGIIHRDLKPGNVLLTATDVTPKEGTEFTAGYSNISSIKITDFGLAKRLEGESGGSSPRNSPREHQTKTGAVLGTPSYMAPEQARGQGGNICPATDVYALGAILYELLTGRPPFRAANAFDTMLQVINDDPVSVRQLQSKVPVDLETICHKALQKDIGKRYPSAKELARDIGRWLNGEPIQARPAGRFEKTLKWMKRKPATAVCAFVIIISAVTFTLFLKAHVNKSRELTVIREFIASLGLQQQFAIREYIRWVSSDPLRKNLPASVAFSQFRKERPEFANIDFPEGIGDKSGEAFANVARNMIGD